MKNLNKYHWLIIVTSILFIFLSINNSKSPKKRFVGRTYPMQVIDNEIRVGDIVLYQFVPVDGGEMLFSNPIQIQESYKEDTITHYLVSAKLKHIPSFIIGETPVTSDLYFYVMEDTLYHNPMTAVSMCYADHVTVNEWDLFLEKLEEKTGRKFAFPTSDEWEYAARGGQKSMGYKYAGSNNIDEVACYKGNTPNEMLNKGRTKKPNELGLFDMSGGVLELTSSTLFDIYPFMIKAKDQLHYKEANPDYRMARGGYWDAPADACATNYVGLTAISSCGARLILKY